MSQTQSNERVWTKEAVLDLIATNALAAARALTVLNSRQTAAERESVTTIERNGRGFNGRDAWLSDVARKLPRYNDHMTPRQLASVRAALPKYWRQLLEDMEERGIAVAWPDGKKPKAATAIEGVEPINEAAMDLMVQEAEAAEEARRMDHKFGEWA